MGKWDLRNCCLWLLGDIHDPGAETLGIVLTVFQDTLLTMRRNSTLYRPEPSILFKQHRPPKKSSATRPSDALTQTRRYLACRTTT